MLNSFFSTIGPGIITSVVDNDAPGITTYSVAGAAFGYQILWTFIPITIALVVIQLMVARMGVVTGKGLADLIRENFGVKFTLFLMLLLVVANLGTTMAEFAGMAAAAELLGISKYFIIPFCAVLVAVLILRFSYKSMEKIFLLMALFYVAYVVSGLMTISWDSVAALAQPSFQFEPYYIAVVIAVVGTTITPWMQFYLQSSIVEKGVKIENFRYTRLDIITGSVITDVLSFFIVAAAAAALFTSAGATQIQDASEAALALKPVAGENATLLFAFGLFNAALFGAFILPLSTAFYVSEAFGFESGVNKGFRDAPQFYTILIAIIALAAGSVLIPRIPLIALMFWAEVLNGIALPIVLVFILMLVNNRKLMGRHTNSPLFNIIAWATIILMSALSIALVVMMIPGVRQIFNV